MFTATREIPKSEMTFADAFRTYSTKAGTVTFEDAPPDLNAGQREAVTFCERICAAVQTERKRSPSRDAYLQESWRGAYYGAKAVIEGKVPSALLTDAMRGQPAASAPIPRGFLDAGKLEMEHDPMIAEALAAMSAAELDTVDPRKWNKDSDLAKSWKGPTQTRRLQNLVRAERTRRLTSTTSTAYELRKGGA